MVCLGHIESKFNNTILLHPFADEACGAQQRRLVLVRTCVGLNRLGARVTGRVHRVTSGVQSNAKGRP